MNVKKYHKILIWILYPIIYAGAVTLLSYYFAHSPVFLQMEYAIYDHLQRHLAIEDRMDERFQQYEVFKHDAPDIFCINLDNTYFDKNTQTINRQKLAVLLEHLNQVTNPKAVLLNFIFAQKKEPTAIIQQADSLLIQRLQAFKKPLILPNSQRFSAIDFSEKVTADKAYEAYPLRYEMPTSAYAAPFVLVGDEQYRYWQYQTEDGVLSSIIKTLLNEEHQGNFFPNTNKIPNRFEINYLLSDYIPQNKPWVLDIENASTLMTSETLAERLDNKIIFIDSFGDIKNEYGASVNKFKTPLNPSTNAIFILLNSYLNVLGQTYIRRVAWWAVFTVNLGIAVFGILFFHLLSNKKFLKVCLSVLATLTLCTFLYYAFADYYLKFPFVFTSLFYVKNQALYRYFIKKI